MKETITRTVAALLALTLFCGVLAACEHDIILPSGGTTSSADIDQDPPIVTAPLQTDPPTPGTSGPLTEGTYIDVGPGSNPVIQPSDSTPPVTTPGSSGQTTPPVTTPGSSGQTTPPVTTPPVTTPPVTTPPVTTPPVTTPPSGAVTIPPSDSTVVTVTSTPNDGNAPEVITRPLALSPDEYYGYKYLSTQYNGVAMQVAYQKLVAGVANMVPTIDLYDENYLLTENQFQTVLFCYRYDYPQHFWLGLTYSYTLTRKVYVKNITYKYSMTKAEAVKAQAALNKVTDDLLKGITSDMSELQRELLIHDRLIQYIDYDLAGTSTNSYNAYGALINRVSACEGYARALQYMLYQVGIQNAIILGETKGISHAWNVVLINGQYYFCDATCDDPIINGKVGFLNHAYFNVTSETLARAGFVIYSEKTLYNIPLCNATAANYCTYFGAEAQPNVSSIAHAVGKLYNSGVRGFYSIHVAGSEIITLDQMKSILGNSGAVFQGYMQEVTGNFPANAAYSWMIANGTNVFTFYFPKES